MKRLLLAASLLAIAAGALAQEFDIFEDNDFLDPRVRGAEFERDGRRFREPGVDFWILRAVSGGISNYTWRSQPTQANVGFLHLTSSIYRGGYQANFKLTTLQAGEGAKLPRYRATTQFGRYFLTRVTNRKSKETDSIADRFLVTASIEENRARSAAGGERKYNLELGAEVDASIPLPKGRRATGSLVWVRRDLGEGVGSVHRLTYFYRFVDLTFRERLRVGASLGVGGERRDRWHWGAARLGVLSSIDAGRIGTVNLTWTPTVLPASADRRVYHEIAMYVDRTLKMTTLSR